MAQGVGFKSYVQFGREATYGTVVPATHKLEILPGTELPLDVGVIRDPSLYNQVTRRALYQGGLKTKGKLRFRCNYEGLAMLLDWAMGSATFGSAGGTSTGPVGGYYTHTFLQKPILNSYTVELALGDIPAGKVFQISGAICTGLTITGQASGSGEGAMLHVELDVLGKVQLSNQAPTAGLAFPPVDAALFHHLGLATYYDGVGTGTALRPRSFELSIKNNVSEDDYFLGSITPDQPVRNDFAAVMLKIEHKFQNQSAFDAAKNFTALDGATLKLNLSFNGGTGWLIISINSGNLVSYSAPISGYGLIISTATWEAFYNATDLTAVILQNLSTKATVSTGY